MLGKCKRRMIFERIVHHPFLTITFITTLPHPSQMADDLVPPHKETRDLLKLQLLRREFHEYPEPMWAEFWTTYRIIQELQELEEWDIYYGIDIYPKKEYRNNLPEEEVMEHYYEHAKTHYGIGKIEGMHGGYTGVIAHLKMGKGGPKIGFRFDIDALHLHESEDQNHKPTREGFRSKNDNMHGCGHDGHISMGLGLARLLTKKKKKLNADIYIYFQPGEEGGLGGSVFSKHKTVKELDYFISAHLGLVDTRKIICGVEFMASTRYKVTFEGKAAHAGVAPQEGQNALLAAAQATTAIHALPRHGDGATRAGVGDFHSYSPSNVISEEATFVLEVRGETMEINEEMERKALNVIKGAAKMNNVGFHYKNVGTYINAKNTPAMRKMVKDVAKELGIPSKAIIDTQLLMGSEDATYLMREVTNKGGKAVFVGLGCPTYGGHHSSKFDFDEDMMAWGVDIFWGMAQRIAGKKK